MIRVRTAAALLAVVLLTSACRDGSPSGLPNPPASPGDTATVGQSSTAPSSTTATDTASAPAFDKTKYSTTDPSSIWVVVNKKHPLKPQDYAPKVTIIDGHYVGAVMAPHLQALLKAGRKAGHPLFVVSGYRSYTTQVNTYDREVARLGKAGADRLSARPGFSEHQTGLAADIGATDGNLCQLDDCFGTTASGRWLADNVARFGFIVRYTKANRKITGYDPEPWHIRYVGKALARQMQVEGIDTLEEFFGVSGGGYAN